MKRKNLFNSLLINVLCIFSLTSFAQQNGSVATSNSPITTQNYVDLTPASEQSIHAVVHIQTEFLKKTSSWEDFFGGSFWEDFFDSPHNNQHPVMAAGSGVLISSDGYILTNNHVVQDAVKVTVTLNNKREFDAVIVGTDPDADLALIKIDATQLPYLSFGNSDNLKVGEWVIAVGNPFNLTSTVTAGIVSAKARNLSIHDDNLSGIESYIQTDAAVNQGNSGGALVNTRGELVGINTAIATGTGYYTGYSFAIPSNIAKKVAEDLQQYGMVQRAVLGVVISEISDKEAQELQLDEVKGIYVAEISEHSAAAQSGLKKGDIILSVNSQSVNSFSELREVLYQYSPGDIVSVSFLRNNQIQTSNITLLNSKGNTEIVKYEPVDVRKLFGADFSNLSEHEVANGGINQGVRVEKVYDGVFNEVGIKSGFIITYINETPINTVDELNNFFSHNNFKYLTFEGRYNRDYYHYTYSIQMP